MVDQNDASKKVLYPSVKNNAVHDYPFA